MYRTGDLIRRLPSRELQFLGRIDHQVKVRGFRIELGEIESVLREHPSVRQAVALVREDAPGDRRLVGYVEAPEGAPEASELRARLAGRLPEHMIPTAFVVLPSFPLLPNGKIDRRSLARIAPEVRGRGSEPPRTEAERKVAAVWRELLGVEQIGVDDKFFELGGHSLLLMRASARLKAAFGIELSLVDLFRFPDVRSLARRLEAGTAGRDGEPEADGERIERMRRGKDRLRERAARRRGTDKGETH
jgi:acyl carrier protein